MPEKPLRLNRELLRYRASLVKIQTGIKNKIHAILAKNNISHDYTDLFGKAGMAFLHSLSLHENYQVALEGYLSVLETVRHEIRGVSKKVQQLAEDDQDSMLLMTIPGVGYYSALLIKSEIGDVKRFPSQNQHGITEAKETIFPSYGFPVSLIDKLPTGKRRNQHQQR